MKKIAVLALQGAFIEHEQRLQQLGAETFEIRQLDDWNHPKDGLILPGGESTTMIKLLHDLNLFFPIRDAILGGLPVYGTCAGLILLAKEVEEEPADRLATMDVTVKRNAYGRQLGSFHTVASVKGIGDIPMTFIRAPYINKVGNNVDILSIVNGHIVAAQQENQLVTSFHPELDSEVSVHQYFLDMI
ncbi:pyridoxal 5'-phosphate synthase glutaminase subunit PdxT [Phocaeicola oris]|uniref:pyridoxal 5'-phosphate synthase glutaminase subunit PdxT n=1 Tax=Phocaeicola oris TaxID=2896850 RepID=UPI00234EF622|nr:pyridoxal 5'-phosphate synthase glutaminase subunit PdxT [Phocaeicola oris]MCE2615978.1 pyridoxal 5'-phosphate synthase glutaminase subunit PdxT [Phocaeicola oris]